MDHPAGSRKCFIWKQRLYPLYMMIRTLEEINANTHADLLWYVIHEHHYSDSTIAWIKTRCTSNLAGSAAERLAVAICDSLLEIPIEERMMVLYDFSFGVTAKYGYCIYSDCSTCLLNKTREERIAKEMEIENATKVSNQTGLSEPNGGTTTDA